MILKKKKKHILFICIIAFVFLYALTVYPSSFTEEELDIQDLEKRILSLGELTTIEYHYQNLLSYEDTKELKGIELPFASKSLLVLYQGYIKAGVDLTDVSITVDDERNIVLKLKAATFTDNVISEENITIYHEKSSLLNPLKVEEVFHLLEVEKKKTQQELDQKGFLKQANQRTEELLNPLLKEMGFEKVTIEFEDH